MITQYVWMLTKSTVGVRQRCVLGVGINHIPRCLPYYYRFKQMSTGAKPETEVKQFEKTHCKQFTTIGNIFNGVSKKFLGTNRNKVSVIGLDEVSVATVFSLINQDITDNICMIDLDDDLLRGELMDLQMGGLFHNNAKIIASRDPAASVDSKICIIFTCTYKANQEDPDIYIGRNIGIVRSLIPEIVKYSPSAIFIIASDPVDILSYASWKFSELPKNQIIGTGTMLDTARFRCLLSQRMGISPLDCHGCIIGEHGENSVPVWSGVSIAGVPIKEINQRVGNEDDGENWNEIFKNAVSCEETVRNLKGYNAWAAALGISNLCRSILHNVNTVMPVSTYVKGEHSIRQDVFLSLPCVIGDNGVTDIIRQPLSEDELLQLRKCAENLGTVQDGAKILS